MFGICCKCKENPSLQDKWEGGVEANGDMQPVHELALVKSQRVHVGIWYILSAQRGSHIPTLRPKYIPYTYMDPLGVVAMLRRCVSPSPLRIRLHEVRPCLVRFFGLCLYFRDP